MSGDTYQAVYDAVSSRIGRCNPSSILEEAARNAFDISYAKAIVQQDVAIAIAEVAAAMTRPSVLYRPTLVHSTEPTWPHRWCASYGDTGARVVAWGSSPEAAMNAFDVEWKRAAT